MAFTIKKHDLRPRYRVQLTSTDPGTGEQVPVDLTAATSVRFMMSATTGGALVVDEAGTFVDKPTGIVEYIWTSGDTDTAGTYNIEFEVMWGAEPQTYPSEGYFTATINEDLG